MSYTDKQECAVEANSKLVRRQTVGAGLVKKRLAPYIRVQESRQHHSTADTNSALFIRVRRNQLPSNQSLVKKNHIRRLRN